MTNNQTPHGEDLDSFDDPLAHIALGDAARVIEQRGMPDFKLLQRVPPLGQIATSGTGPVATRAVLLDIETDGLSPQKNDILELACLPVSLDAQGVIVEIGEMQSWLEDPRDWSDGTAPRMRALRDVSSREFRGARIDTDAATALLTAADVIISHNASHDRPFVEERLPRVHGTPWACTMTEVDWSRNWAGRARALEHILMKFGCFAELHRAADDVAALAWLLGAYDHTGATVAAQLLARAARVSLEVRVHCGRNWNTILRNRGFRWSQNHQCWVKAADDEAAVKALRESLGHFRGGMRIEVVKTDWTNRHR